MGGHWRQQDEGSSTRHIAIDLPWVSKPTDNAGFFVASIGFDAIATLIVDGLDFTLLKKGHQLPGTVAFLLNENAGQDLTLSLEIEGFTYDGSKTVERLDLGPNAGAASAEIYQSVLPYYWIDRITPLSTPSSSASDLFSVGFVFAVGGTPNPGGGIMLPAGFTSATEYELQVKATSEGVVSIDTPLKAADFSNRVHFPAANPARHYRFAASPPSL